MLFNNTGGKDGQKGKTFLFCLFGRLDKFAVRINYLEIGTNGYVTQYDFACARGERLKPLNWFERWIAMPYIESEQKRRRAAFAAIPRRETSTSPVDEEIC